MSTLLKSDHNWERLQVHFVTWAVSQLLQIDYYLFFSGVTIIPIFEHGKLLMSFHRWHPAITITKVDCNGSHQLRVLLDRKCHRNATSCSALSFPPFAPSQRSSKSGRFYSGRISCWCWRCCLHYARFPCLQTPLARSRHHFIPPLSLSRHQLIIKNNS